MVLLISSALRMAVSRQIVSRGICVSASQQDTLKTPIQELGWEYLQKQKSMKRPISPHLQIYAPQVTWYVSGLHRITGCVMAGVLLIGGVGFAVLPIDFTTFVNFIDSINIPMPITAAFKWIVAFPIAFHSLNGIRFLGFDLAKGTDIVSVYKSAYLVLGLSALIATVVVINAIANKNVKN